MSTLLLDLVINFINNHFETIVGITALLFCCTLLTVVLAQVRWIKKEQWFRAFGSGIRGALLLFLSLAQVFSLIMLVSAYIMNRQRLAALDLSARVQGNTEWVKDSQVIYFISDKELVTVNAQGKDRRTIFSSDDMIQEYHFSPDGRHLLVLTESTLFYLGPDGKSRAIDSWQPREMPTDSGIKGSISGIAWSPDSEKFCYRLSRWSRVSSQDIWSVYDLVSQKGRRIRTATRQLDDLVWDRQGQNLYFLWFEALDTTRSANPFLVKVYRVPLATLKPELAVEFPFHTKVIPEGSLALRDIEIFKPSQPLSFGKPSLATDVPVSRHGGRVGVDPQDYLFYQKGRWYKKRLYLVPRVPRESDIPVYQYRGGDLAVQHLTWLPSGKYLIMAHHFYGTLILDPETGKVGILVNDRGSTFGWPPKR